MTLQWLKRSFEYESWANRQVLDALAAVSDSGEVALRLLSHIIASQALWLNRMKGEPQEMVVWPDLSLDACASHLDDMEKRLSKFLEGLQEADLQTEFSYTNTKAEPWTSVIGDALTHLLLHSSYHRGQIAAALRRAGIDPPYTDYIHATRRGYL